MTEYELAHYLFEYDEKICGLRRKVGRGPARKGDVAGGDNGLGYFRVAFNGSLRLCSHIVWLMHTGEWPVGQLDHRNRDTLDDRIENLRDVTQSLNLQNQEGPRKQNQTGFRGVSPDHDGRFKATITVDRQQIWLGRFDTPEEAHEAYLKAKEIYHEGAVS